MRDWIKKAGSLALALGALGLALVHAAATHGCASTRPPAAQAPGDTHDAAAPAESAAPGAAANTISATPSAAKPVLVINERCGPGSPYMYPTKAPVWIPPECRDTPENTLGPQRAPSASKPQRKEP
jgi:hypothetical protein